VVVDERADRPIYVLGLGGSLRRPSESEVALRMALRDVVHALRAWPTPIGVPIHESRRSMAVDEEIDEGTATILRAMGAQVVGFALAQRAWRKALSALEGSHA
jgi:NAD(P)H-dependent FMN reductase